MHTSKSFTWLAMMGTLVTCGGFYAPAASAANETRGFYQNAGANCHGEDGASEGMLARTEQRLRNTSARHTAYVVCNMMTDPTGAITDSRGGVVTYVAIWAKRYKIRADNTELSCTLVTSYADASDSEGYTVSSASSINPLPMPSDANQAVLEWVPPGSTRFFAPVNLLCVLPPKTELNDWYVEYEVDDAS